MKKILTVVLAAALLLTMTSCALAATGVGSVTSVSVTAATAEKEGSVSVTTTMCAVTLDEEGKIVAVQFDAVQPKGSFDTTGAVAGEVNAAPQSKKELKEGYGMKGASKIGKEWYEQMDALEAWCMGKTVAEVLSVKLDENGYPADVDLVSGCTIHISEQLAALANAASVAK